MTTSAPSRAKASATPAPIPELLPVTGACFFSSFPISVSVLLRYVVTIAFRLAPAIKRGRHDSRSAGQRERPSGEDLPAYQKGIGRPPATRGRCDKGHWVCCSLKTSPALAAAHPAPTLRTFFDSIWKRAK